MDHILTDIVGCLRAVGPEVVFFVALVETALFIGLLVPAEATVLAAAFFAAEGIFELEHVMLATILGALAGDQIGYALGRFGGRRFAARGGWIGRIWNRHEPRAVSMFGRHPVFAVTLARFVSFVRTLMPWFAGMTRVRYPRFFLFDLLGVVGWGAASVMAGYLAGESWHVLAGALGTASAVIIGLLVLAVAVWFWRGRQRRAAGRGMQAVASHTEPAAGGTEPGGSAPVTRRRPADPEADEPAGDRVYRVALTGNIASGKSVVAAEWERLGAAVVDADELARLAVEPGTPGYARVIEAFGEGVSGEDGRLDRAALRRIVFDDPAKRRVLERIVHPEVARLREEVESRLEAAGRRIVVHVIPLLFEVGLETEFDDVVLVDAPEPIRLRRLIELRGVDESEAGRIMAAQMPAERKRQASTVIDNDGTMDELKVRAGAVWRAIVKKAGLA